MVQCSERSWCDFVFSYFETSTDASYGSVSMVVRWVVLLLFYVTVPSGAQNMQNVPQI